MKTNMLQLQVLKGCACGFKTSWSGFVSIIAFAVTPKRFTENKGSVQRVTIRYILKGFNWKYDNKWKINTKFIVSKSNDKELRCEQLHFK